MNNFDLKGKLNGLQYLIPDTGILSYLSKKEKVKLSSGITVMTFERKDILYKQNMLADHLVYVIKGLIKVFNSVGRLPGRVADLLRYFSEDVFKKTEFTVSLSRQEMAELIGTTKESFIRILNEFKNDKIIDLDGKNIKIISTDLIKVLSEIG